MLRQGDQPSALVLDGADAFGFAAGFRAFAAGFCAFAAGFCVLGGLVLITEGALAAETAAHSSATCSPFGCGSVAGAASRHSRNGSLISNRPRSPADQPSEECAVKIRKSCCSSTIASSFLTGHSTPCRVEVRVHRWW